MQNINEKTLIVSAADLKAVIAEVVRETLASTQQVKEQPVQPYYTIKEAAAMLKVTRPTLNRWELKGTLTPYRVGNSVRYRVEDVQRLMKGGEA